MQVLHHVEQYSYLYSRVIGIQDHAALQHPLAPTRDTEVRAPDIRAEVIYSLEKLQVQGPGHVLQTKDEAKVDFVVHHHCWFRFEVDPIGI